MSRRRTLSILAGLALLLFSERAGANPVVIVGNFGPPPSYNSSVGWAVEGAASLGGGFDSVAMPFSSAIDDYQLLHIDIALEFSDGTNSAIVTLNADSGGAPGAVLLQWTLAGLPAFGSCCLVQTLTPSSALGLSIGAHYWIVASPGAADTRAAWMWNNVGASGLIASDIGSGFRVLGPETLGAFAVVGEPRARGTAVPEPATGLISAVGLMLLGRRRAQMRGGAFETETEKADHFRVTQEISSYSRAFRVLRAEDHLAHARHHFISSDADAGRETALDSERDRDDRRIVSDGYLPFGMASPTGFEPVFWP